MADDDNRGGSRITRLNTEKRSSRQSSDESLADLKVVGIGGGGSNAVERMIEEDVHGI